MPGVLEGIAVELWEWIFSKSNVKFVKSWELKVSQLVWLNVQRDLLEVNLRIEVWSQRFNGDLGFMPSCKRVVTLGFSLSSSRNLDNMELNVLSNGLVLELDEKDIVIEATVLKVVSGVVIVWNELDAPFLFQVKIEKSVVLTARNKVNIVISANVEVFVGGLDRQRSKISLSARMPQIVVWPDKVLISTYVHFN